MPVTLQILTWVTSTAARMVAVGSALDNEPQMHDCMNDLYIELMQQGMSTSAELSRQISSYILQLLQDALMRWTSA